MTRLDLYALLPEVHRRLDAEEGGPLRALFARLQDAHDLLADDVERLYGDWFIETCEEWVVPYLADLVRVADLPPETPGLSRRALVADALRHRRRKGTPAMLESLARDATGWPARVVPLRERVARAARLDASGGREGARTVPVRDAALAREVDGPFDRAAHAASVRGAGPPGGGYAAGRVAFFLWDVAAFPLRGLPAARSKEAPHGWLVSPLGDSAPLLRDPAPLVDDAGRVARRNVPHALTRVDPDAAAWMGPGASFALRVDGEPVEPGRILLLDLSAWARPPPGRVAFDPETGRLAFPEGWTPREVRSDACLAGSGGVGAWPRPRGRVEGETFTARGPDGLDDAKAWLAKLDGPGVAHVVLADDAVHALPARWTLAQGRRLVLRAASDRRPVLRSPGGTRFDAEGDASVVLEGVVVDGGALAVGPGVREVVLREATLVPGLSMGERPGAPPIHPGAPSLAFEPSGEAGVLRVERSVTGPLVLPSEAHALRVTDSVVDAGRRGAGAAILDGEGGAVASIEGATVLGETRVGTLDAVDSIFTGRVHALATNVGLMDRCWVPPGSATPARVRCQPDLALARAAPAQAALVLRRARPVFASTRHGDPRHARLDPACPAAILRGGRDGAEMGAFRFLRLAQREAGLLARLDEHLPVGLDARIVHADLETSR